VVDDAASTILGNRAKYGKTVRPHRDNGRMICRIRVTWGRQGNQPGATEAVVASSAGTRYTMGKWSGSTDEVVTAFAGTGKDWADSEAPQRK